MRARQDGRLVLLLGCILFVVLGTFAEHLSETPVTDFTAVYYGARCLIQHHDPYNVQELSALYTAEGGTFPSDPAEARLLRMLICYCVNLPTTILLIAPLAILPFKTATAIWMAVVAACFIFAAFLVWDVAARYAPEISGGLLFLLVVGGVLLLSSGNTAGLVVSLTVIAVWCLVRERFAVAGVVCLAVSLAVKPHDAGFVWLYFFLAGGVQRKRALQALAVTAVLGLTSVLWVSRIAPDWSHELQANVRTGALPGGANNPGPTSAGGRGVDMMINLQTVVSRFDDDPGFYNPVVYGLCGALLLAWCVRTFRSGFSADTVWFGLAAAGALSLLPVYHRSYDAKLLLLTVPACAMLWAREGAIRWWALALTAAAILSTSDLFWILLFHFTRYSRSSLILSTFPAPLLLLLLGVFYLWMYVKESGGAAIAAQPA